MQRNASDAPDASDAACRQATGKTLAQWFAALDSADMVAAGRRALVQHVYEATDKDEWWATTIAVEFEKARGLLEKDGKPKGYSICSTKTVAAPIDRAFAAFGDAKALGAWFGKGSKVSFAEGGILENAAGDRLQFTRIRTDKDLRAIWTAADLAPGSQVEVLFADKGKGKVGITLNHTRIQARRDADLLRAGWSACFDALKAHLEGA